MPSRSTKITLLLVVDVLFFFVELIAGYAVGSLALVADSFHMLNDVMSLIVALYAIKLSKSEASPKYSYGWHRAEIVAALINGVFLLALCFSIFMEAMERFFSTPEVSNPKLVVIVGSLGLASNFLGLFLFHEHSHSHKELPKSKVSDQAHLRSSMGPSLEPLAAADASNPEPIRRDAFNTLYGHPVATRASVVQAAQDIGYGKPSSPSPQSKIPIAVSEERGLPLSLETAPSGDVQRSKPSRHPQDLLTTIEAGSDSRTPLLDNGRPVEDIEIPTPNYTDGPVRNKSRSKSAQGSSGSMNMHALILHVIGDALGNVGVIATGLIIWLSTWQYKYYFDPIISLVITVIIFSSALPLVLSASFILLQAVPSTVSLEDLRKDIQRVEGVLSVHELHVWQLSENKIVASVHVWVSRRKEYMLIAHDIREVLHDHGVHSSTIQPEFHTSRDISPEREERLVSNQETHCLIPCPPNKDCNPDHACCPPQKPLLVDV